MQMSSDQDMYTKGKEIAQKDQKTKVILGSAETARDKHFKKYISWNLGCAFQSISRPPTNVYLAPGKGFLTLKGSFNPFLS